MWNWQHVLQFSFWSCKCHLYTSNYSNRTALWGWQYGTLNRQCIENPQFSHSMFICLFQIILKQLVAGALAFEDKNIFHRDIKVENVLIETGSDVPRVWLIDFGLSCFVQEDSFKVFYGTLSCFSLPICLPVYPFALILFLMRSHSCILQAQLLTLLLSGTAIAATVLVLQQCGSWECYFMKASTENSLRPKSLSGTN